GRLFGFEARNETLMTVGFTARAKPAAIVLCGITYPEILAPIVMKILFWWLSLAKAPKKIVMESGPKFRRSRKCCCFKKNHKKLDCFVPRNDKKNSLFLRKGNFYHSK